MTIYAAYDWLTSSELIKSHNHNGGYDWENINGPVSQYVNDWYKITSVEVSPTNKDTVWIGFGGFLNDYDVHKIRVMLSVNGGASWAPDYSSGLPNMPVNCLKYTSKGRRLFAATDAGVFYRDYTMSNWQSFNTGLPLSIVTDLEINDSTNTLWASTFGRGVWATDLNCLYDTLPVSITQDKIWNSDTTLQNSIVIDSSYTLTINRCTVHFPPQAKIYVKQGAKLIVEHSVLTNSCHNFWQGIEVWGRSNIQQNLPYQGFVWIKDSSLIENAWIGITTANTTDGGAHISSTSGGLISIYNSTFRNNYKALEFLPYPEHQVSQMIQTTFETNGNLIDGRTYPKEFVSMEEVEGIRFWGCTFKNMNTGSNTIPNEYSGDGIYSLDASFSVTPYYWCPSRINPCPDLRATPALFQGLHYGIKAINTNPVLTLDLEKTRYDNNQQGIYLANMNYARVVLDTFNIAANGSMSSTDTCYGIYLDHCSRYTVQENHLTSLYLPWINDTRTVGIVVNNSGSEVNEIYNNYFDKVKYGIIAENQNRNPDDTTGLCIKCNDFSNTLYDIIVNKEGTNTDFGIARNQGWNHYQTDPAGNTFSQSHKNGTIALADIDNYDAVFNYFHHLKNLTYRVYPDYSDTITPQVVLKHTNHSFYSPNVSCPSKLSGGGGSGSEEELKQQLTAQQQSVDSVSSTLLSLTDGGSTNSLNNTVANSFPSQALELLQQLLSYSPYLSDTVMKTAINHETVLPNEMIRDILVANPQAPKSEGVMDQLNNRFTPMPDTLLAEIQNGISILGKKDSLGAILYNHLQTKHEIFNKLVNIYHQDTVNPSAAHDSLIELYTTDHTLAIKYQLAFEYLNKRDTNGVHATLIAIPSMFSLTPQENSIHQSYITYFNIMNAQVAQSKSNTNISPSQLATLRYLIENGGEPVQSLARNMLIANNLCMYHEPIILPDETKSIKQKSFIRTGKISPQSYMKLFPNPASVYIIVEYNLRDKFTVGQEGEIIVTTLQGQQVESKLITKQQDQILISTLLLPMGTYLCTLKLTGKVIETQHFIIIQQ